MSDTPYFDAYMKGERSSSYCRKNRNMQLSETMQLLEYMGWRYVPGVGFSNPYQEVFLREPIERTLW